MTSGIDSVIPNEIIYPDVSTTFMRRDNEGQRNYQGESPLGDEHIMARFLTP